jgi:hypothetical protein
MPPVFSTRRRLPKSASPAPPPPSHACSPLHSNTPHLLARAPTPALAPAAGWEGPRLALLLPELRKALPVPWAERLRDAGIIPHIAWEPRSLAEADEASLTALPAISRVSRRRCSSASQGDEWRLDSLPRRPALYREKFRLVHRVLSRRAAALARARTRCVSWSWTGRDAWCWSSASPCALLPRNPRPSSPRDWLETRPGRFGSPAEGDPDVPGNLVVVCRVEWRSPPRSPQAARRCSLWSRAPAAALPSDEPHLGGPPRHPLIAGREKLTRAPHIEPSRARCIPAVPPEAAGDRLAGRRAAGGCKGAGRTAPASSTWTAAT